MNDLDIVDMQMNEHYAVLVTSDSAFIIRHSVPNLDGKTSHQYESIIVKPGLRIGELLTYEKDGNFLLLVTNRDLTLYYVNITKPSVRCKFSDP